MTLFSAAWIGGFLYLQRRADRNAEAARSWPTAAGSIKTSMLVNTAGRYAPVVTYSYEVDGTQYHRSRIRFGAYTNMSREDAQTIADRYHEGAAVQVYYDPDRRNHSVLELGQAKRTFFLTAWVVGGLLLFLTALFAVLAAAASGRAA